MYSNISFLIYFLVPKVFAVNVDVLRSFKINKTLKYRYSDLNDHTMVTNSEIFPYVVAILKKSTYVSAGALIDENFVLTAADSLYLVRESKRVLRVRLGSINNKKGGQLLPIKFYEIHPFFSDTKPEFDIALIKLAQPVRVTPSLSPIRLQKKMKEVTATHFIVTAWPFSPEQSSDELQAPKSMEEIKRRRIMQVAHLHPTEIEKCEEELEVLDINSTETLMCLDAALGSDPCARETGAPVVLNGVLWGIMSSYRSEDCEAEPVPSFVSLVAARDIASWIHSIVSGHRWNRQMKLEDDSEPDEEYEDNNV